MPITPHQYSPQPFTAYVRFWIDGELLTLDGQNRPRYLTGFGFRRGFNEVGEMTISLVDPEWDTVHNKLIKAEFCAWQFGYEGGKKSPVFTGRILRVTPNIIVNAVELTIEVATLEVRLNQLREVDAHPNTQMRGESFARPSEYVKRMLQRKFPDYSLEIVDAKELMAHDSFSGGMPVPMRFTQQRQTDLQFIRNTIAPYCISEADERGPYILNIDPEKKEIYFGPPKVHTAPTRLFTYMVDPYSEVISFNVESQTADLFAQKGGERVAIPFLELYNKSQGYVTGENSTTPQKTYLAPHKPVLKGQQVVQTRDNHPLVITTPTFTQEIAKALANTKYFRAMLGAVQGELVILGDYDRGILPNNVISVLVLTPKGDIYHTSGNYLVMEITDEVQAGSWTTTLHLTRDGVLPPTGETLVGNANTAMAGK